jgi:hypothetical protein
MLLMGGMSFTFHPLFIEQVSKALQGDAELTQAFHPLFIEQCGFFRLSSHLYAGLKALFCRR